MNKQLVVSYLQKEYPKKNIICIPEENPNEIICEIDPTEITLIIVPQLQ
ncbi:MAG: hypothetical protein UU14_C0005G0083 [Candidatus Roizmanbacteria bacterium GW2011_GWB1_40_7]|uniref:Uncharacterized protein n=2 Tax=Candidatus Roizmaniibacteriota TaxID=1752723 RepID=A0A0G0XA82_9BACT|nr:MAG: hypothetical protein UT85_C0031G0008 [Candidatus Levybacteria bacterium GW2011_GWA2_40_16]KKR72515.1 MAG: hypothetical protein UU14_C0005G0083 [Candidatus Roizmanbacteria bacterium GW2011_GWB1_40_7]KKS21850.1 MAG: hypothetical protein UU78_C0028G0005 [Candidatus Roizmanbacteria bacterium GW2011_GWC2_41_7]